MKRGDIVVVATRGVYSGKPRPALIVQTDLLNPHHPSLIVAPLTTEKRELLLFRMPLEPSPANGLREPSDIMLDKLFTAPKDDVGRVIGHLDGEALEAVNRSLSVLLDLS